MNFDKYYDVYEKNSFAQKKVAENLFSFMKENKIFKEKIATIFEIGCGTGIFTRLYRELIPKSNLILNDIFDVEDFFKELKNFQFIKGNIENLEIPKVDLIVSSSVFQWIKNLDELMKNISNKTDNLCFSTYIFGNLIEIKNHFSVSLNYLKAEELENILKKYFQNIKFQKETIKLNFENPMDVLKHLKYTGVTGFQKSSITKIKSFKDKTLTYEVAYFICKK